MGGPSLFKGVCVWLGVMSLGLSTMAQDQARGRQVSDFAKSRLHEALPPNANGKYHFGIMGQVARPGVYELSQPDVQLLDLIRHAGGLTRHATNQLRIVRQGNAGQLAFYDPSLNYVLVPGDIVVADGPISAHSPHRLSKAPATSSEIQTADFVESPANVDAEPIQVALIGVLDRPVILPVPLAHANLSAVVAYLGQDPRMTSHVKVLQVGRRGTDSPSANADSSWICPCVLYFNPRQILADPLPKFADVYRPEEAALSLPQPDEVKTADISLKPSALPALSVPPLTIPPAKSSLHERAEPQVPHSEVVLPAPSLLVPSEPPMISSLRELEQRIPTPAPIKAKNGAKVVPPSPTPVTAVDLRDDAAETKASKAASSWWPYLGLALLAVAVLGILLRGPFAKTSPAVPAESFVPVLAEDANRVPTSTAPRERPLPARPVALDEDLLTALVFNQLPIVEETPEPAPPEGKPASRKIFRLDPPEKEASVANRPYMQDRPQPKPTPEKHLPQTRPVEEPTESLSLLDRVLQRANERRAA